MKNWKTTGLGIASIVQCLGGVLTLFLDGNPATNPDWNIVGAQITTAIGLIFCRDFNVTSEGQKIKKPKATDVPVAPVKP
jgi:hypothetical protein